MTDTSTSAPPTMLTRERIIALEKRGYDHVCDLAQNYTRAWRMRIPSHPDDSDLLLTDVITGLYSHGIAALDRIEAQETEIGRLREALRGIAEERYPQNKPLRLEFYDLEGDHEFDARHAFPCRIQWLTAHARAALAATSTPQEDSDA